MLDNTNSKLVHLPNTENAITCGHVYKLTFPVPQNLVIPNIDNTVTEVSLHFLLDGSQINEHTHDTDAEAYFEISISDNQPSEKNDKKANIAWKPLGICSNGNRHGAKKGGNFYSGILAGVKFKSPIKGDTQELEDFLISKVLPTIMYNPNLDGTLGFVYRLTKPEQMVLIESDKSPCQNVGVIGLQHSDSVNVIDLSNQQFVTKGPTPLDGEYTNEFKLLDLKPLFEDDGLEL